MKLKKDGTSSKQGEGGGKPLKYKDFADLFAAVALYLKKCQDDQKMPNKAGLCSFLGIVKDTYLDYKKRRKFADALKEFEARLEDTWVQRLAGNSPTGAIFYLKNAFKEEYKDRTETEMNVKMIKPILGGASKKIKT